MEYQKIDLSAQGIKLYESKHKDGDIVTSHHHKIHQILYALEGEGRLTLDQKPYEFTEDSAALILPYSEHAIVSESKLTLLVLAFDGNLLKGLDATFKYSNSDSNDCDSNPASEGAKQFQSIFQHSSFMKMNAFTSADLRQLLRKMLFEQINPDPFAHWANRVYLYEILLVLARAGQTGAVTDSNSLRAERIRKYIDTHYYEPITSTDIAGRLGISSRHVNNIFKEQYQMTPTQYLTEVRIGLTKKLLTETNLDIASICFEVGYESLATFYRTFKQVTGMSPNQFRQTNKSMEQNNTELEQEGRN